MRLVELARIVFQKRCNTGVRAFLFIILIALVVVVAVGLADLVFLPEAAKKSQDLE